ncbi:MAG: DNA cytosine methyltransferase [Dehalococcoidales bacterium]|nr:DNA cytosine methyltransferase [Dehalococcoidales bacterium]
MKHTIPVIDLFAGPGGLSEGFSCFRDDSGKNPFNVVLSIEKDPIAHQTLELRSFFRFLDRESDAYDYFRYLRREITKEELFKKHQEQAIKAKAACWMAELGSPDLAYSTVKSRINSAIGKSALWLLIGGPPCQAYSVIGRARVRSVEPKQYENDNRHFLYKEYLKIVADYSPPMFLMENVKGLLSTQVNGLNMFAKIVKDLEAPGVAIAGRKSNDPTVKYEIFSLSSPKPRGSLEKKDYVVRSELFGIPQKRHRVFLLGIRSDLLQVRRGDICLNPQSSLISVGEVIRDLPKLRSGLSTNKADCFNDWHEVLESAVETRWFLSEDIDTKVKQEIEKTVSLLGSSLTRGAEYLSYDVTPSPVLAWYIDSRLRGVCNHSTRGHIPEDLHRYLYASCFARVHGHSPDLEEYPISLLPKHRNVTPRNGGMIFSDRFRVQMSGQPASTITCHISKDGHYYIHPDPTQCRSLTVREAARIQTFPDNYYFEGSRTDQYRQVGNAVPPLLAWQIAGKIYGFYSRLEESSARGFMSDEKQSNGED